MGLSVAIARAFDLIFLILLMTIFLSWFPNVNWNTQPFRSMKEFSEIFLAPFRKFIPPIGMIDISPIVAFFVLSILAKVIIAFLVSVGL